MQFNALFIRVESAPYHESNKFGFKTMEMPKDQVQAAFRNIHWPIKVAHHSKKLTATCNPIEGYRLI